MKQIVKDRLWSAGKAITFATATYFFFNPSFNQGTLRDKRIALSRDSSRLMSSIEERLTSTKDISKEEIFSLSEQMESLKEKTYIGATDEKIDLISQNLTTLTRVQDIPNQSNQGYIRNQLLSGKRSLNRAIDYDLSGSKESLEFKEVAWSIFMLLSGIFCYSAIKNGYKTIKPDKKEEELPDVELKRA